MVRIEACVKGDRHEATQAATDAISAAGASILDSHFFSGVAVAIVFEIDDARLK